MPGCITTGPVWPHGRVLSVLWGWEGTCAGGNPAAGLGLAPSWGRLVTLLLAFQVCDFVYTQGAGFQHLLIQGHFLQVWGVAGVQS